MARHRRPFRFIEAFHLVDGEILAASLDAVSAMEPIQIITILLGVLDEVLRIVVRATNSNATRQIVFLALNKR